MGGLLNPFVLAAAGPPPIVCPTQVSPPSVAADCIYVYDTDTGCVLYTQSPDSASGIASLAKLATSILLMRQHGGNLAATTTVGPDDPFGAGSVAGLQDGDVVSWDGLLKCMIVASGGDAAQTVARVIGNEIYASAGNTGTSGITRFVDAMNALAAELGLSNTTFIDPHGGNSSTDNTCTAHDAATLAAAAFAYGAIATAAGSASASVTVAGPNARTLSLTHTSALITAGDAGVLAAKTGSNTSATPSAGYCMAWQWQAGNGNRIVGVVLRSDSTVTRVSDSRRLIESLPWDYDYLDPAGTLRSDPYWANVVLLVGADSGTAVDESSYGRTLTAVGGASVSSASPLLGTHSMVFDGSNDRFEAADAAELSIGNEDFTIELVWSSTVEPVDFAMFVAKFDSSINQQEWFIGWTKSTHRLYARLSSTGSAFFEVGKNYTTGETAGIFGGTRQHSALTRSGSTVRLFHNGTQVATITLGGALFNGTAKLMLGARQNGAGILYPFSGKLDEVRITKGVARYSGDYLVPIRPFPRT